MLAQMPGRLLFVFSLTLMMAILMAAKGWAQSPCSPPPWGERCDLTVGQATVAAVFNESVTGCPQGAYDDDPRHYFYCRYNSFIHRAELPGPDQWRSGDVAFFGASYSDLFRVQYDPIMPGGHNFGVAGLQVPDMSELVGLLMLGPDPPCSDPSRVFVASGRNDLQQLYLQGYRAGTQLFIDEITRRYRELFVTLEAVSLRYNDCPVIIQSLLPLLIGIASEEAEHHSMLVQTNDIIEDLINDYSGLSFADISPFFYSGNPDFPINLDYYIDPAHLNCDGQKLWMNLTIGWVYPTLLPGQETGFGGSLRASPSRSPFPYYNTLPSEYQFRYALVTIPANQRLFVTGESTGQNYTTVWDPEIGYWYSSDRPTLQGESATSIYPPAPPVPCSWQSRTVVVGTGFEGDNENWELHVDTFVDGQVGQTIPLAGLVSSTNTDRVGSCGTGDFHSGWIMVDDPMLIDNSWRVSTSSPGVTSIGVYRRMANHDMHRLDAEDCDRIATVIAEGVSDTQFILINTNTPTPTGNVSLEWELDRRKPIGRKPKHFDALPALSSTSYHESGVSEPDE